MSEQKQLSSNPGAKSKQEKLLRVYGYVKDNLYLCHSNMQVGTSRFNSNLLLGLLTSVNRGKQLCMGEYGLGKTTSAEVLLSMTYGIPKTVMSSCSLKGHAELTQEKMTARLDLGQLNQGNEKPIWSNFVLLEPKIVDELNRIPESKQNLLLWGMDKGEFQYLNELINLGEVPIFNTINYKDSGNNRIVEALIDRCDVSDESKFPGVNPIRIIRHQHVRSSHGARMLNHKESEDKLYAIMKSDKPYTDKRKEMIAVQEDFKKVLEKRTGLELLTRDELNQAYDEIRKIRISDEADLLLDFVVSELYSCMMFGQKRSNEGCVEGCHYKELMCGKKTNCESVRNTFAENKYMQSLAWLLGEKEVSVQHVAAILPFVLNHKMRFTQNYIEGFKKERRKESDPLQMYVTKKSVADMMQRWSKQKDAQASMFSLMEAYAMNEKSSPSVAKAKLAEAQKLAKEVDHPVFYDYLKID
ncbi:hypothetical protein JXB28_01205 [Candidatus Woesearchaeota archaeon]|nr:hypothetical protein [Candidatus Woesearchaeota archaeon]